MVEPANVFCALQERSGAFVIPNPWDIGSAVSKPVNVVMETRSTMFSVNELTSAGVQRISVGSGLVLLAYGSLIAAAREIGHSGTFGFLERVMDFTEVDGLFKQATDK